MVFIPNPKGRRVAEHGHWVDGSLGRRNKFITHRTTANEQLRFGASIAVSSVSEQHVTSPEASSTTPSPGETTAVLVVSDNSASSFSSATDAGPIRALRHFDFARRGSWRSSDMSPN